MSIFNKLAHKKDSSLDVSSPRSYMLHGVKIHKLTVAKYVEFLKIADDLPSIIFNNAFPDAENFAQLIDEISKLDKKAILELVGRLLTTVPSEFCRLLANLLEFDEARLLDVNCADALSLNQLVEIITAFIKANDYSNFFVCVQKLMKDYQNLTTNTTASGGSNAG